jgi:hypothetical protein
MKSFLIALCAHLLVGCASTPPLVYKYYPAKVTAQVTVTQTIDCDADKRLIILNTPSVATVYSSNREAKPFEFDASKLSRWFTDNDFTFAWYDDGRIRSLNSQVTGQGEAIVKAVTVIASAAVGAGGPPADTAATACKVVASRGGKPVTIVYERTLNDLTKRIEPSRLDVSENYKGNFRAFKGVELPKIMVKADIADTEDPVLVEQVANGSSNDTVPLKLSKTTRATVTITKDDNEISKSTVVVPNAHTYDLLVPRGAFFGKETFSVQFNEAGILTQVSYGKTSGFAAALNSANTLDAALSPNDAAKANALKSQADVMAQTARLANCQAKPSECK